MTFEYFKEKIDGKKIINQNLFLLNKIGEGSFWSVFKVERNIETSISEKNFYALKEGNLNFIIPEDHIIYNTNITNNTEENLDLNKNELDLIEFSNSENNDFISENYYEEMYNDKNIEKGF